MMKRRFRRRWLAAGAVLAALAILVALVLKPRKEPPSARVQAKPLSDNAVSLAGPPSRERPSTSTSDAVDTQALESFIREESRAVGSLDENSEETQRRLDDAALQLDAQALNWLADRALKEGIPEDERFLCADLLARAQDPAVLPVLERIVVAPFEIVDNAENTRGTIEWLIRARALEGFENFAAGEHREEAAERVRSITTRMSSSFLVERSAAVLRRLQDPASKSLEERDAEALRDSLAR